jgi:hypothetical protein
MKTLPRVSGEMALHILAYNLTPIPSRVSFVAQLLPQGDAPKPHHRSHPLDGAAFLQELVNCHVVLEQVEHGCFPRPLLVRILRDEQMDSLVRMHSDSSSLAPLRLRSLPDDARDECPETPADELLDFDRQYLSWVHLEVEELHDPAKFGWDPICDEDHSYSPGL